MDTHDAFRTVLTGRGLLESPRWHDDHLVFSDWASGEVVGLTPDGTVSVLARVSPGAPFCLDRTLDGDLLIAGAGALRVVGPDDAPAVLADLAPLSDKPWNDVVRDGRGNVYVDNIGFAFGTEPPGPGLIAVVGREGPPRVVAADLAFPNGLAVTPDGGTLLVAESYAQQISAYAIADDGSLRDRRVWAAVEGSAPDGICVDAEGAVWYADVPNRCCVRVAEGGRVLQRLTADLGCFSCTLGDPDRRTLYVTAAAWPDAMAPGSQTGTVLAARVDVPGAGWPG